MAADWQQSSRCQRPKKSRGIPHTSWCRYTHCPSHSSFLTRWEQIERFLEGRKKSPVRQGVVRKYDIEQSALFVWRLLNIQGIGQIREFENFDPIFILGSISLLVRFESLANLILLTFTFVGLVPPKFLTDSPI
jgi:hypothetical protein